MSFETKYASGINGAVQQKVNRFFVKMGRSDQCTITYAHQIAMEAKIKCKPLFCFIAQSRRSSSRYMIDSFYSAFSIPVRQQPTQYTAFACHMPAQKKLNQIIA
jgi:hypothetical protein